MQRVEQLTTEAIAERYGAAWDENDLEAIMAMQGDDMVFQLHAEGFEPAVGPEAVRADRQPPRAPRSRCAGARGAAAERPAAAGPGDYCARPRTFIRGRWAP